MTITDPQSLAGLSVLGPYGVRLGRVHQAYVNVHTALPEWVAVSTGPPDGQIRLMPLAEADHDRDALHVPYDLAQLTSAPIARPAKELSAEDQRRLYPHYGLQAGPAVPPPDAGDQDRSAQAGPDDAATRSEERLQVSHEEVRVERDPIGDAGWDHDPTSPGLTQEHHEVVLHGERPVIGKQVVPLEQIWMVSEVAGEDQTVSEDLGKERIAYETTNPEAGHRPPGRGRQDPRPPHPQEDVA